eukprot:CAMPEP_0179913940 /NCGR_PEP_ID=MMETSP0983-20121128/774_1 /TAXON_ID=483367 /ORGANISM="non described non described, Strain CCMP 2436" /LENGTH=184 /DNA_ID=CAMNT_0021816055 /DNA_START=254 /DNA_END=806 /DNA_ORIENTATION=+
MTTLCSTRACVALRALPESASSHQSVIAHTVKLLRTLLSCPAGNPIAVATAVAARLSAQPLLNAAAPAPVCLHLLVPNPPGLSANSSPSTHFPYLPCDELPILCTAHYPDPLSHARMCGSADSLSGSASSYQSVIVHTFILLRTLLSCPAGNPIAVATAVAARLSAQPLLNAVCTSTSLLALTR